MADVGDRVQIPSKRVGQAPREGVVVGVSGGLLRVEWSGGEQTTLSPSGGSLVVVGRVTTRARKTPAQPRSRVTPRKAVGAARRPRATQASGPAPARTRSLGSARKAAGTAPKKAAPSSRKVTPRTAPAGKSGTLGPKKQAVTKKAVAATAADKKAGAKKVAGHKATDKKAGTKKAGTKKAGTKKAGTKKAGAKKRSKHRK